MLKTAVPICAIHHRMRQKQRGYVQCSCQSTWVWQRHRAIVLVIDCCNVRSRVLFCRMQSFVANIGILLRKVFITTGRYLLVPVHCYTCYACAIVLWMFSLFFRRNIIMNYSIWLDSSVYCCPCIVIVTWWAPLFLTCSFYNAFTMGF